MEGIIQEMCTGRTASWWYMGVTGEKFQVLRAGSTSDRGNHGRLPGGGGTTDLDSERWVGFRKVQGSRNPRQKKHAEQGAQRKDCDGDRGAQVVAPFGYRKECVWWINNRWELESGYFGISLERPGVPG